MHYYHFSLIQCIQFCILLADDFCRADSGFHWVTLLTFSRACVIMKPYRVAGFPRMALGLKDQLTLQSGAGLFPFLSIF